MSAAVMPLIMPSLSTNLKSTLMGGCANACISHLMTRVGYNLLSGLTRYSVSHPKRPLPVEAHDVGSWKFKGNPEPLDMVHVIASTLVKRQFPSEPPKGKVSHQSQGAGTASSKFACIHCHNPASLLSLMS